MTLKSIIIFLQLKTNLNFKNIDDRVEGYIY